MSSLSVTRRRLVDDAIDTLDLASSVDVTKARLHAHTWLGDDLGVELKVRHVRTPSGSRRYGLPIGAPITADARRRAKQRGRGGSGGGGESRPAPAPAPGRSGGSGGGSGGGKRGSGRDGQIGAPGRGGRGGGGNGGGGPGGGGPGGALGGLAGLAGLLAGLFAGDKGKKGPKPKKPKKGRKPKKGGKGGGGKGNGGGGKGSGSGSGKGSGNGSSGGSDVDNGQYRGGNGSGGGSGLNNPVSRGNADYIGKKTLRSVEATRERLADAVKTGEYVGLEVKVTADTRLYFFGGPGGERNTGIAATSAADARKRKRRGGDRVVAVHKPNAQERAAMDRGEWVRTRRDGKTPDQSRYGHGRGQGPPRK